MDYITGFSANIDVFERFKFENELATLNEKNRLYLVTSQFAEVDLHPDVMSNAEMGDLFEFLIYKFAEASNEEAGEHYTSRDAIRLMVDLLFAEESAALLEAGTVRTIYDPTARTGGMLSVAEERLLERNPEARLRLYVSILRCWHRAYTPYVQPRREREGWPGWSNLEWLADESEKDLRRRGMDPAINSARASRRRAFTLGHFESTQPNRLRATQVNRPGNPGGS